jgi:hypothetical protein
MNSGFDLDFVTNRYISIGIIAPEPIITAVPILTPLVVVDAGHFPALGSDMTCPRTGVCASVHGVEPVVGGNNFHSRISNGRRLTDHDIFFVADYKTLRGDACAASILWVMRSDV